MISTKRSQAWGLDLFIGTIIFIVGILIFYLYVLNSPDDAVKTIERLTYEGRVITNTLLSEGYPRNWNNVNVVNIGLLSDNKIDHRKLREFYLMTRTDKDYSRTQSLFNTRYDYYFFLEEQMTIEVTPGNFIQVDGIGKPGVTRDNFDARNMIKTTRFMIYNDRAMSAYLYVMEK